MPTMDSEENPFYNGFMGLFKAFVSAVETFEGCEVYAKKIARWDPVKMMTQFLDVATPMKNGFQILNHGDIWLNNMMFNLDAEKNPIEISLIDYQISFWASPSADLLYFLLTSVSDDIKVDHFDDFIEFYHSELISALKQLKYDQPIPTLAELQIDLLEKGAFGER